MFDLRLVNRYGSLLLLSAVFWIATVLGALATEEKNNWRNLYFDAKPVLDVRYRYEHVDQDGVPKNANANTVRTRAGPGLPPQLPSRVITPRISVAPGTSGLGCSPDENSEIPDVRARRSGVGVIPKVLRRWL